jgi:aspartate aminotransferase-like enzyme
MPAGVDGQAVVGELRRRFGVTIAGGQGELRGRIVRIGHIGYVDVFDVSAAIGALELVLAESGAAVERGVAVARALEVFEAGGEAATAPAGDEPGPRPAGT